MNVLLPIAFVLAVQTTDRPCPPSASPSARPTLVVQAVDQLWLPLPGATVRVSLGDKAYRELTDRDGVARFALPKGAYRIDVEFVGFKTRTVKRVDIDGDPSESIPHVQLQLPVKAPREILE